MRIKRHIQHEGAGFAGNLFRGGGGNVATKRLLSYNLNVAGLTRWVSAGLRLWEGGTRESEPSMFLFLFLLGCKDNLST